MTDHEGALQAALVAHLRADAGVTARLGSPARVWDEPPDEPAWPHLLVGRSESRPVAADGCGIEHRVTLTVVSRFGGSEETRAAAAAVRAALHEARLAGGGVRTANLRVVFSDVYRAPDRRRTFAVMRVRAVTEEMKED